MLIFVYWFSMQRQKHGATVKSFLGFSGKSNTHKGKNVLIVVDCAFICMFSGHMILADVHGDRKRESNGKCSYSQQCWQSGVLPRSRFRPKERIIHPSKVLVLTQGAGYYFIICCLSCTYAVIVIDCIDNLDRRPKGESYFFTNSVWSERQAVQALQIPYYVRGCRGKACSASKGK